jgi:broad specificity phosphatase PhoE
VTTFVLVRHAAHAWLGRGFAGRMAGVGLNEEGRQQAEQLVERLAHLPLAAIYCSPQQRTQETAQPLAARRSLAIGIDAAFDEVDLGDWTGRSFEEVRGQAAWQHWLAHRGSAQPPGGEPFAAVAQRAMAGLRRLERAHPAQQVLVVSHGDVLKAMVATAIGLSLDLLEGFDIAPASISILAMGEDWAQLQLLNARGPLR